MKRTFLSIVPIMIVLLFLSSCRVQLPAEYTPLSSSYGSIDSIKTRNGFPKKQEPWVVISDRANNTVFLDNGDKKSLTTVKFLEPLLVVEHDSNDDLIKVAKYIPEALTKKVLKSSVKTYGWVPKDHLLLWTNAVKKRKSGFNLLIALVPDHPEVLKNVGEYIKNDSILLYSSPDLTQTIDKKVPVGQLAYIYKQAENNTRFLVGKRPSLRIDSIKKDIYGWVSSHMVASWGARSSLKILPDPGFNDKELSEHMNDTLFVKDTLRKTSHTFFKLSEASVRAPFENLVSTQPTALGRGKVKFFGNALDYSKNFIYNVFGAPLYYPRYKEIINRNNNLNILFVLNISRKNMRSAAIAKSVFQQLQMKLDELSYYRNIKFGTVLFENDCEGKVVSSGLSFSFRKTVDFIDKKASQFLQSECEGRGKSSIENGLAEAGDLLSEFSDETNIVVFIGATASDDEKIGEAIRKLSAARARIISFQTVSGASNLYNNFVLLSENLVTSTAKNIAELEKRRSVDQNTVLNKSDYDLQQGAEGVFSLDYPKRSMTQGFVIYPRKGEVNSSGLLINSLDTLLSQVTHQNKQTDSILTSYFKSPLGVSRTYLKSGFQDDYPGVSSPIPEETASQFVVYNNPFLVSGSFLKEIKDDYPAVKKGILISEEEYDDLRKLYQTIYEETKQPFTGKNYDQEKAVNSYVDVLMDHIPNDDFERDIFQNNSMAYSVAITTGFDNASGEILGERMLKQWTKRTKFPSLFVKKYFEQYEILAKRLLKNKNNPNIQIIQGGQSFYWLSDYFMPKLIEDWQDFTVKIL